MFICISQTLTWPCSLLQWQRCAGRRAAEADRGSDWEFPGACQERADLALCLEPRRHRGARSRTSLIFVSVCFKQLQSCSLKKEAFFCQAFHQTALRRGGQRKGYNLLLQFSALLTKSLINPHQMNCPRSFEAAELSCYILSSVQVSTTPLSGVWKSSVKGVITPNQQRLLLPCSSETFCTGLNLQKHQSRAQQFLFNQVLTFFSYLTILSVKVFLSVLAFLCVY